MNFTIISVGKLKENFFIEAANEYVKRIGAFASLNLIEIPAKFSRVNPNTSEIEISLLKEGKAILEKLNPKAFIFALCVEGKELSSLDFSRELEKAYISDKKEIVFIIGGDFGLSEEVKARADFKLSLSEMTFPHRLAKIILLEQLYRALNIQNNGNYHK